MENRKSNSDKDINPTRMNDILTITEENNEFLKDLVQKLEKLVNNLEMKNEDQIDDETKDEHINDIFSRMYFNNVTTIKQLKNFDELIKRLTEYIGIEI